MKKVLVVLALLFCLAETASAQAFRKGTSVVDVGLGLGWGFAPTVGYEYGVTDKIGPGRIGVGATASLLFFSGYSAWLLGPKASYHFDIAGIPPEWDLYGGFGFYFGGIASGEYIPGGTWGPYFGGHLAARYYFSQDLAAHLMFGASGGFGVTIGVSFRF